MTGPNAGQVLGRYELLLPVAKGGMAQVWAAQLRGTRGFQKMVAVKTILAGTLDDVRMEQMLLEEATLAAQIHHANVVGTIELGEQDGVLYLVMDWVDGESLGFIMSRAAPAGGIPLLIAVNLMGQVCKGLHAAHELRDDHGALLGLVHRDLSAQNVLVTYSGTAKLVDFGIAKATARSSSLTVAGEIKGKFAYMSPEQVSGQTLDRRSDIFGLGVLLYVLTTGRHPFKGDSVAETVRNICLNQAPTAPSEIVAGYPSALEAIVMKALAKSADNRWATAHDMLAALEDAVPLALEPSFEAQVGAYMNELLGTRATERRAQLRLAQQVANRLHADSQSMAEPGSLGSLGSLRTVSVEGSTTSTGRSLRHPDEIAIDNPSSNPVPLPPARSGRFAKIGLGVATAGVLVALVASRLYHPGAPLEAAAARANDGVPMVPVPPMPMPMPMPMPDPSPRAPNPHAPSAAASAVVAPASPNGNAREAARPVRKAAPPARSSSASSPSSTTAASPTGAAPETSRSERVDAGKANAWDTDSFGGRR